MALMYYFHSWKHLLIRGADDGTDMCIIFIVGGICLKGDGMMAVMCVLFS